MSFIRSNGLPLLPTTRIGLSPSSSPASHAGEAPGPQPVTLPCSSVADVLRFPSEPPAAPMPAARDKAAAVRSLLFVHFAGAHGTSNGGFFCRDTCPGSMRLNQTSSVKTSPKWALFFLWKTDVAAVRRRRAIEPTHKRSPAQLGDPQPAPDLAVNHRSCASRTLYASSGSTPQQHLSAVRLAEPSLPGPACAPCARYRSIVSGAKPRELARLDALVRRFTTGRWPLWRVLARRRACEWAVRRTGMGPCRSCAPIPWLRFQ